MVKDCLGGVLFIDEAYALGNPEKRDSFAKECIDTLCEALSDHKDNLMVIIAGYEEELKSCFFDYNQGLDSRFTWRFKTTDYNAEELKAILKKKSRTPSGILRRIYLQLGLIAVCPKYPAIRSARTAFLKTFFDRTPILLKIFPISLATSVFPVPGGP